jgi:hypothetical protein
MCHCTRHRHCHCHCTRSDAVALVKHFAGGSDKETVVHSDHAGEGDSDSDAPAKDYVRGLAQRAIDPDFRKRKEKGPFVVSWERGGVEGHACRQIRGVAQSPRTHAHRRTQAAAGIGPQAASRRGTTGGMRA